MKIFLSKDPIEIPKEFLVFCKEKNIELLAKSCIEIEFLEFEMPTNFDYIFFASKNAVLSVLKDNKITENIKIIAAGKATAEAVNKMGYACFHFYETAGEIAKNAQEFKELIDTETVLFPCSNLSKNSYSSVLEASQKIKIQTYETKAKQQEIPPCTIYVFTSPSNFNSFILNNNFPDKYKIISWGESTSEAIKKSGFVVDVSLNTSSFEELIGILSGL